MWCLYGDQLPVNLRESRNSTSITWICVLPINPEPSIPTKVKQLPVYSVALVQSSIAFFACFYHFTQAIIRITKDDQDRVGYKENTLRIKACIHEN